MADSDEEYIEELSDGEAGTISNGPNGYGTGTRSSKSTFLCKRLDTHVSAAMYSYRTEELSALRLSLR